MNTLTGSRLWPGAYLHATVLCSRKYFFRLREAELRIATPAPDDTFPFLTKATGLKL
jgi:hypothetical protein